MFYKADISIWWYFISSEIWAEERWKSEVPSNHNPISVSWPFLVFHRKSCSLRICILDFWRQQKIIWYCGSVLTCWVLQRQRFAVTVGSEMFGSSQRFSRRDISCTDWNQFISFYLPSRAEIQRKPSWPGEQRSTKLVGVLTRENVSGFHDKKNEIL